MSPFWFPSGHAEVVDIQFDPSTVSYDEILNGNHLFCLSLETLTNLDGSFLGPTRSNDIEPAGE